MAIYYTSSTALGGGVGSYADPFTLQEAFDTATAGDEVRVLNDGTYYPTTSIDVDTNAGTVGNEIVFRGRNSGDTAYEMATISGSSLPTNSHLLNASAHTSFSTYTRFQDLRLTATSGTGRGWTQVYNRCRGNVWRNCRFDNFPQYAMFVGQSISFYDCEFHDNLISLAGVRGSSIVSGCSFRDGVIAGSNNEGDVVWVNCIFYNHSGQVHKTFSGSQIFISCTFDKGTYAIYDGVVRGIINCIFSNFTTQAVNFNSSYKPVGQSQLLFAGNYFYNNTADTNITPDTFLTANNTFAGSDPQYVSTTAGAEDYNLQSGSPAEGTGVPSSYTITGGTDMSSSKTPGAFAATGGGSTSYALPPKHTRL